MPPAVIRSSAEDVGGAAADWTLGVILLGVL
jgi:hypothetical protein